MDYHAIHGHDIASFPTSETREPREPLPNVLVQSSDCHAIDRLPTVSASQVLDGLGSQTIDCVPSGVEPLDKLFSNNGQASTEDSRSSAGVKRGQVTDAWGPPGTGKTAFGYEKELETTRIVNSQG